MGMPPVNPWTAEKDEEMRTLVARGFTARQIAETMGAPFTRNSVIGRCFRAGLNIGVSKSPRVVPIIAQKRAQRVNRFANPPAPTAAQKKAHRAVVSIADYRKPPQPTPEAFSFDAAFSMGSDPLGVPLMDLQWRHCRWPLGKVKDVATHFCGEDKVRGSYCEAHGRLAYTGTDAERRAEYRKEKRRKSAFELRAAE